MSAIDRLERAKGGPFTYRHNGQVEGLPSPADIPPNLLEHILQKGHTAFRLPPMPEWKAALVFTRWAEHYDLPSARDVARLRYLIERYEAALEYDLRVHAAGADLGELWRTRRWRYLLNLIDHLPRWSYFSEAVSKDPEHADMLAKAAEASPDGPQKKTAPPMTLWTPEVAVLADVVDSVRQLKWVLEYVNTEKGKTPKAPEPYARPESAIDNALKRAEYRRRLSAHEKLAARMLPHKRKKAEASD